MGGTEQQQQFIQGYNILHKLQVHHLTYKEEWEKQTDHDLYFFQLWVLMLLEW